MSVLVTKVSRRRRWRGAAQQRRNDAPWPRALPAAHQATPQVESSQRSGRVPNAFVLAAQVQVMVRALRFYAWPVTPQHPVLTGGRWVGIPGVDPRRYSIGQPGNPKHLRPTTALSHLVAAKLGESGYHVTIIDSGNPFLLPSRTTYQG